MAHGIFSPLPLYTHFYHQKDTTLGDEDLKLAELVGPFAVRGPMISVGSSHIHQWRCITAPFQEVLF